MLPFAWRIAATARADLSWPRRLNKPFALLAYLLVTGQPATRRHLIDLLFDGPDDPLANLRWTLAELRHAIGAEFIAATRQGIAFNFACDHTLDVAALLGGDTSAYRGEFLAGLNVRGAPNFEAWVLSEGERLYAIWRQALAGELVAQETSGNYTAAIGVARRLLAADNLDEQWHRALMRLLAQAGQREAALAQFDWCCRLLKSELDVPPADETVALAQAIRQRMLAASTASASPTGAAAAALSPGTPAVDVPHNLPMPPTPFVGRNVELAEIAPAGFSGLPAVDFGRPRRHRQNPARAGDGRAPGPGRPVLGWRLPCRHG